MKQRILLILVMILFVTQVIQAYEIKTGADKFATITYPATACDINLEEGTIETWVRIDFNPDFNLLTPDQRYYKQMSFFVVKAPNKQPLITFMHKCGYNLLEQKTDPTLLLQGELITDIVQVRNDRLHWKKGEWHHLALTWKNMGKKVQYQLYVDGNLMAQNESEPNTSMHLDKGTTIEIGAFNCSYASIDSFRISSVQRKPQELLTAFSSKTLEWDRYTLLLDKYTHIDSVANMTTTVDMKTGIIRGTYELLNDPPFSGIKLHVVEEE